jgi:hypothetical protein
MTLSRIGGSCEPSSYGSARLVPRPSFYDVPFTDETFHVIPFPSHIFHGEKMTQGVLNGYEHYPRTPHFGLFGTSLEGRPLHRRFRQPTRQRRLHFTLYEQRSNPI